MSEEEAELARLSENACRNHARPTDRLLQVRKWQEVYMKHLPHLEGKKASGHSRWSKSAKAEAKKVIEEQTAQEAVEATNASSEVGNGHGGHHIAEAAASGETTVEVEVASEIGSEPEPEGVENQTFRDRVKAVTGVSDRTLSRDLRISKGLTEEQVNDLAAVRCTQMGMLKIIDATPNDSVKRGEIVNLVASGMEVEQAINEVVGTTTTKDQAGRVKEVGEVEPKAEPETEEEWFRRTCGDFASKLSDIDQYKSDAILYRQLMEERDTHRKKVKMIINNYKKTRNGKRLGPFYWTVYFYLNASHPIDWEVCPRCEGCGMVDPGDTCPACKGACYKNKAERYL